MKEILTLFRGHKDPDYLRTYYCALSFTENKSLARAYGLGQNDSSNSSVADGAVTTVIFNGTVINASENGLGNIDKHIHKYKQYDGVRFRDGVFAVLNRKCLTHVETSNASKIP